MPPQKKFGDLPKAARERAYAIGERRFGLSKSAVRNRYNRGTYDPYARKEPEKRIPKEFRGQMIVTSEGLDVNWEALARQNISRMIGPDSGSEYYKYNDAQVREHVAMASTEVQRAMALATIDEFMELAFVRNPDEAVPLPFGLTVRDIGYYVDSKKHPGQREWINLFWYH